MSSDIQKALLPWLDCSESYFQKLYQSTWDHCMTIFLKEKMAWCQLTSMPVLPKLIQEDFLIFLTAVFKVRAGLMIPFGKPIEEIIHEAPRWTFAVFLGALIVRGTQLLNKGKIKNAWEAYVPEPIGSWLKSNIALVQCLQQLVDQPELLAPHLLKENNILRVILEKAYRPLSQKGKLLEEGAFLYAEDAVPHVKATSSNALSAKVARSRSKGNEHNPLTTDMVFLSRSEKKTETQQTFDKRLRVLEQFLSWLAQKTVEERKTHVFMMPEGLLVSEDYLQAFIVQQSPKIAYENFLGNIRNYCLVNDNNNNLVRTYRRTDGNNKERRSGILIAKSYLTPYWQKQYTHENFIEAF